MKVFFFVHGDIRNIFCYTYNFKNKEGTENKENQVKAIDIIEATIEAFKNEDSIFIIYTTLSLQENPNNKSYLDNLKRTYGDKIKLI
ncbi:MAG: hypothetical protein ACP5G1_03260, partial [Nanopusillaceae archaeon]